MGKDESPEPVSDLDAANELVANLETALEHRSLTSAAVGIIMERYGYDYETAFATLVRVSNMRNEKLFTLAVELIDTGRLDGLPERPEPGSNT